MRNDLSFYKDLCGKQEATIDALNNNHQISNQIITDKDNKIDNLSKLNNEKQTLINKLKKERTQEELRNSISNNNSFRKDNKKVNTNNYVKGATGNQQKTDLNSLNTNENDINYYKTLLE